MATESLLGMALTSIEAAVGGLFGASRDDVKLIYKVIGNLSFVAALAVWAFEGFRAVHGPFLRMIVKFAVIAWLIEIFPTVSGEVIKGLSDYAGEISSGGFALNDPGAVLGYGLTLASPILDRANELGGFPDFFYSLPSIFLYLLSYLAFIVAFCVLAVQFFMTFLEWRFLSLAAYFCLPFALLGQTSFIAEKSIGYVASTGAKVFVLGLTAMIPKLALANFHPETMSFWLALESAVLAAATCVLALKAPAAAAGLINGGPVLNASDAFRGMTSAISTGLKTAGVAMGGAGLAALGASAVMQSWSGAAAGAVGAGTAGSGIAGSAAPLGSSSSSSAAMPSGAGRSYPGRPAGPAMGSAAAATATQALSNAGGAMLRGGGAVLHATSSGRSVIGGAMMNKGKSVEAGVANSNTPVPAAGGSSGSRSAGASGGFGSNYDWRGQGPGGLGADVAGMSASQAAETISERARQRPDLPGNDQMAPTAQQWGDAALIGTDITGMSRGQAGAALDAHMGWFQARESGGKADGSGGQASRSYPATSQAPAGSRGGGVTVTGGGVNVKDTQGSGGAMPEQGSGPAQESGKATGTNGGGMNPKYSGFDAQGESWVQHRLALLKSGKSLGPS